MLLLEKEKERREGRREQGRKERRKEKRKRGKNEMQEPWYYSRPGSECFTTSSCQSPFFSPTNAVSIQEAFSHQ